MTHRYGHWPSPITAELAASSGVAFQDCVKAEDALYWSEMRPHEAGRVAIMKRSMNGEIKECLPAPFSARTRVHEYGGGAFTVMQGSLYFVNDKDQILYQLKEGEPPQAISDGRLRFADLQPSRFGLIAVAEDNRESDREPKNYLVKIDVETGAIMVLTQGWDFYSSIAISKDNHKIAWITWQHPDMPWDNSQLWHADLNERGLRDIQAIHTENHKQSFFQPQWDDANQLWVVSDQNNWWTLYQVNNNTLERVFDLEGEMGLPLWVFGLSTWGLGSKAIFFTYLSPDGKQYLANYHDNIHTFTLPYDSFSHLRVIGEHVYCVASAVDKPPVILKVDRNGHSEVLYASMISDFEPAIFSRAEHLSCKGRQGRTVYGYFYGPKSKDVFSETDERPPLLVLIHGGPTARATTQWDLGIQYWTSRGFAVIDVNYAGSTGYGRAYRESLDGHWGEYDVDDCLSMVEHLIASHRVDPKRIVITGSSAGGLTVLSVLAKSELFCAGAVRYGVTDLRGLVHDTHKFEAHYLDKLIGPYPEDQQKYIERSPVYFVDDIHTPILFFHGEEDKVVPLSQTREIVQSLEKNQVPCEMRVFAGEQHGFRQATHREAVLSEQLDFFRKCFDRLY